MKIRRIEQLTLVVVLSVAAFCAQALDFPHSPTVFNNCVNCHDMSSMNAQLLRVENPHPPENIDDTIFNNLCWSCHNGVIAPFKKTHSSLTTDNGYGNWAMECRTCHNPHSQVQTTAYFDSSYLASGTSTGLTTTTLTKAGAGWAADEHAGRLLIPNTSQFNTNYRILGNTSDTLTLGSLVDLAKAAVGDTFAIIYGKLIKHEVSTPNSGTKPVRFFQPTGTNSFADGNATLDGICEVCHTQTNHFRNNGAAPDQGHSNVGGAAGQKCTESCHLHSDGFAHGGGGGGGLCITCHGHEPGTLYDPDLTAPHTAGAVASQGKGTVAPHSTHTEAVIATDTDDKRGPPGVYCDTCHNVNAMPSFKSGTDANGDGKFNLAETDVCNTCHSSGGAYDGVNDAVIGAKNNWHNGGVYAADGTLKPGKEKWCVGCHDMGASVINARQAPDVGGDGVNYGFYSSGHGSKGQECKDCHEQATSHNFDGQKTYLATSNNYQLGYRLKSVNGQPPMNIPLDAADGYTSAGCFNGSFNVGNYRLCLTCHESYGANTMGTAQNLLSDSRPAGGRGCSDNPYKAAPQTITGFRNESAFGFTFGMSTNPLPGNGHWDHLVDVHAVSWNLLWRSDDTGTPNSRVSCPTCHNPHGDSYGVDTPTIRMTNTVFQLEWGNNATGDYGVLGATGQINTRCWVSCHFGTDPSIFKYYRAHTSPFLNSMTVADTNNADPLPAEAGYTNGRTVGVSFSLGGAAPTQMQCAEDISFTVNATGWIPYTGPNYNYTLSDSDGNKNVSCQLRNEKGSSHIKTVSIILDRQGPTWTANVLSAPNGTESWAQGSAQSITWNPAGVSDPYLKAGDIISLEYSIDGGATFPNSIATGEANDGSYAWTVPIVDSTTARVRVSAYDKAGNRGSDASNANFTIQPITPTLSGIVVADNDGADPAPAEAGYTNKQSVAVTLSTTNYPTQMMLAEDSGFSVNSTGWIAFNANATYSLSAGDGSKTVHVKVRNSVGESATQNAVIVQDTGMPTMQATTLTAPNGGEFWSAESTQNVTWSSGHITDANLSATPIKLAYSADGGASYGIWSGWEANDGSYSWILPSAPSYNGKMKVVAYDKAGNTSEDASNAIFSVSPSGGYVVTNTADSGAGSLRQVMTDLVAAGGNNTIWFNIPSGSLTNGVAVINFTTSLPDLSAANIVIDGASQTALVGNTNPNGPEVLLDGPCTGFDCLSTYANVIAFNATAADVTIKNLQIVNVGKGVASTAANTRILGNHFGYSSDTTGYASKINNYNIALSGNNPVVGGSGAGDRNYISCAYNSGLSVSIASGQITGAQIINNTIGLRSDNTTCANNSFTSGGSINIVNATNGLIQGNVFIGSSYGISVDGTSAGWTVKGNTFGAWRNPSTGVWTSLSSPSTAIYMWNGSTFTIGGPNVATSDANLNDSNVIDPATQGIYLRSGGADNKIFGNFIGTNPERTQSFTGSEGIYVQFVNNVTIGGADAGEAGNVIANMTTYGVNAEANYIELSRNSFYNNGDSLWDDAIYLKAGANGSITRPTINAATVTAITIGGVSGGNGGTVMGDTVEVYLADFGGSEYGEGKTLLGTAMVPFGATTVTIPVSGVAQGQSVTATRTIGYTNYAGRQTSAFSRNARIGGPAVPTLAWTGEANYTTDGVDPNSGPAGNFTFRVKWADADNDPPDIIEVWLDINNNGSYDANEKFAMAEVNAGDTNYVDGKLYTKTLPLAAVLDGIHDYRFYAGDGASLATGTPMSSSTVPVQACANLNVVVTGTYFEAENFIGTLSQGSATFVQETATAGYNGTGYLRGNGTSSTVTPPTEQGKVYPLNFPVTGNYKVWMRARSLGGAVDSVFVGKDGDYTGGLNTANTFNAWVWKNAAEVGLSTLNIATIGSHPFNIWVRDSGLQIDAFYLTTGVETPTDATVPSGATVRNPSVCTP